MPRCALQAEIKNIRMSNLAVAGTSEMSEIRPTCPKFAPRARDSHRVPRFASRAVIRVAKTPSDVEPFHTLFLSLLGERGEGRGAPTGNGRGARRALRRGHRGLPRFLNGSRVALGRHPPRTDTEPCCGRLVAASETGFSPSNDIGTRRRCPPQSRRKAFLSFAKISLLLLVPPQ